MRAEGEGQQSVNVSIYLQWMMFATGPTYRSFDFKTITKAPNLSYESPGEYYKEKQLIWSVTRQVRVMVPYQWNSRYHIEPFQRICWLQLLLVSHQFPKFVPLIYSISKANSSKYNLIVNNFEFGFFIV